MTELLSGIGAITLFVQDVGRAKSWYQTVFDRPTVYEDDVSAVMKFEGTLVNLLQANQAEELIAPAPVGLPGAGSQLQLTIWVDDADSVCALLATRGVTLVNGPIDRPWGQRTACFADPDGYIWEIAQSLS
jgi:catechol 2,3-dioxygenase-like lactoylglutathione lyase family enzyme